MPAHDRTCIRAHEVCTHHRDAPTAMLFGPDAACLRSSGITCGDLASSWGPEGEGGATLCLAHCGSSTLRGRVSQQREVLM